MGDLQCAGFTLCYTPRWIGVQGWYHLPSHHVQTPYPEMARLRRSYSEYLVDLSFGTTKNNRTLGLPSDGRGIVYDAQQSSLMNKALPS